MRRDHFHADPRERRFQPQSRLDADEHQVERIGKAVDDLLLPPVILLLVLILLHILVNLLLPLRWPSIRGEFRRRLEQRLREDIEGVYSSIPGAVAETLRQERRQIEQFLKEIRDVAVWLEEREQAATIAGLYGK